MFIGLVLIPIWIFGRAAMYLFVTPFWLLKIMIVLPFALIGAAFDNDMRTFTSCWHEKVSDPVVNFFEGLAELPELYSELFGWWLG